MDLVYRSTLGTDRRRFLSRPDFLNWIAEITGKQPVTPELYVRAATHGSHGEKDYQRLEFLGDRVLGLVIADHLYHQFPNEPEGQLSQRLNGLVSGSVCGEVARQIGVGNHVLLGKQARDDGARKSVKVLGDVMESLIGAVYIDHGMDAAREFILSHWENRVSTTAGDVRHPKSALQEWAAANNRKIPEYELVDKSGPDHDLKFTVRVSVRNVGEVMATASAIQAAQTEAAKKFLETFT
ncbi:ribonuclease III [Sphingorhabdus sp. 109]|uniref:ribonuclease III n=1 Tax=Sphingorhabdus sp. 109 TaxID=2653173 RepID=UPI0012EF2FC7|nr:Ribonuclease 3 [Sphingorhabdus sp. 109]